MDILKVSSKSRPGALAGAISSILKKGDVPEAQAIGANAICQAVKGVAIAGNFAAQEGKEIVCQISFVDVEAAEATKTAIRITVSYKDNN